MWPKLFVTLVNWPPQQLWCCLRHSVTVVTDPHKPWRVASPECQRFCPCLEAGHHHHCHHHPQHWHLKSTILFDGRSHNFRPNYSSPCCLGHSTNVIGSIITLPRRRLCLLCSYRQGSSYSKHRHHTNCPPVVCGHLIIVVRLPQTCVHMPHMPQTCVYVPHICLTQTL